MSVRQKGRAILQDEKKFLIAIFILALVTRFVYILVFSYENSIKEGADAISYNAFAEKIVSGFNWIAHPVSYRAPGYPFFLAAIYFIFSKNFIIVKIVQAVINALTVILIYFFAKDLLGKNGAKLTAVWAIFYGYYFLFVGEIGREIIIIFLLLITFYFLNSYLKYHSEKPFLNKILFGLTISYTLLIHTDTRYLFYLPFFSILFVIYNNFWIGIKKYLIFLGIVLLFMVPWTVRNYIAYDGFVLINTRTLDLRPKDKRNPVMDKRLSTNVLNFGKIATTNNKNYPSQEERNLIKKGKNPKNRSKEEIKAIIDNKYPASGFLARKWFNLRDFWRPFRFKSEYRPFPDCRFEKPWSSIHNLSAIITYGLLLPFMIISIINMFLTRNKNVWLLLFPIFIQNLLHILQWGRIRYRVPIDAFIIMLGCYGIFITYNHFKHRDLKKNKTCIPSI